MALRARAEVALGTHRAKGGWVDRGMARRRRAHMAWRLYRHPPAVHTAPGQTIPEWHPWPGETTSVELSRPDGVPGQSLTIDSSEMSIDPGLRATDVKLTLSVRSSRGATHVVTLPDGAQLESISVNGASQPVRQDGGKVTIAIVPGQQNVVLAWRQTPAIGVLYRTPAVDLGAPSVNATIIVHPGTRWILLVLGPRVGPAVLFWSSLIVLLFVAASLGRIRWTPLRWWHWTLLAVGLSQVHIVLGALFAGWLIALGWRKERVDLTPLWFDTRQLVLGLWTLVALILLAVAIHQGLLGTPEMQLQGNESTVELLRWFSDRSGPTLPTALLVSVPMLVYRIAMLAWALWVALALLRWLKWGWSAFSEGGLWKAFPKRAPVYPQQWQQQAPVIAAPAPQPPPAPEEPPPPPPTETPSDP
jgi:hypothetical protein